MHNLIAGSVICG